VNLEIRAEFLNIFNNINFIVGNPNNDTNNRQQLQQRGVRASDQRLPGSIDHLRSGAGG